MIEEIKKGTASGYGILSGELSGNIFSVDIDGDSGRELLNKALKYQLPKTVEWTSGREGRTKLLFKVPNWASTENFKSRRTETKVKCADEPGKSEGLEIHWDGKQDVLPPSVHPMTGKYYWVNSPEKKK
ncbi:MAG: bifunctional DNA primase/polymerase [Richelia sp. SM1_7_0]|nr:bifunctional DNA primase/polymerase [Richelia sp. SM1_7_0]